MKKGVLEISQNSKENTCTSLRGVFRTIYKAVKCFRKKVEDPQSCNFTEKETSTQLVSSEI